MPDLPMLVADTESGRVGVFPRETDDRSIESALMKSADFQSIRDAGIGSLMRVRFNDGEFRCDSRRPREPNFEIHAAAELFAELFAMRLEIDRLRNR
jgi:hypothetical protein